MAGAPKGNQNAANGKLFDLALKRALARAKGCGTVDKGLEKVAAQLVRAGIKGQQWAVREIADRMDGRPAQTIVGAGGGPLEIVTRIERVIRGPNAKA